MANIQLPMADSEMGGRPRLQIHHDPTDTNDPDAPPRTADLLKCFLDYEEYFKETDEQPEADIRPRFLIERNKRAKYAELLVHQCGHELEKLEREARAAGASGADIQEIAERLGPTMMKLDEALRWYSQMNYDDTQAARALTVDRFIMDNTFRWHMRHPQPKVRAPNAMLRTLYGEIGEPAPASLFAMRGPEDNILREFILNTLTNPVTRSFNKLQRAYKRLLGGGQSFQSESRRLNGRYLDITTKVMEFMISATCLTGSVLLLYNLEPIRKKIIALPFMSILCAIPVSFLTRQAKGLFMLMAGIWAVLTAIAFLQAGSRFQ